MKIDKKEHAIGDTVTAKCSSSRSKPAQLLDWQINGVTVRFILCSRTHVHAALEWERRSACVKEAQFLRLCPLELLRLVSTT